MKSFSTLGLCSACGNPATGTFWVAYHEDHTFACVAIPCCETCGQDELAEWDDGLVKAARPKGFWPGVVTDDVFVMSSHLTKIAGDFGVRRAQSPKSANPKVA